VNEESVSLTTNYTWTEIALLPYPWYLFSMAESMDTSSKCYPGYLLERDCFTDSYPVIPAYNLHDASWKITRKNVQREYIRMLGTREKKTGVELMVGINTN